MRSLSPKSVSLSLLRKSVFQQQMLSSLFVLVQYLSTVILTCITLSFPGMCSNAASLKLLAPLIPLKPQRLPLAFSHDGSAVVFIVCGLIFCKASRVPVNTPNPLHTSTHTHAESDFTWFLFNPQLNYKWYL